MSTRVGLSEARQSYEIGAGALEVPMAVTVRSILANSPPNVTNGHT